MKQNKLVLFFCVALPVSLLLRMLQLFYTVDPSTGFFNREYESAGIWLTVIIAAVCAAMAVLCFNGHRNPENPPKAGIVLALASAAAAVGIGNQTASVITGGLMNWQLALTAVFGIISVAYFAVFALSGLLRFKLPPIASVIPALYFLIKTISSFVSVSSLALISDTIMLLAAYCLAILFFLSFGRLYNGINTEYNFRSLSASGFVAAIVSFTQAIPYFIVNSGWENAYAHTTPTANLELLGLGIFITAFTLSHFSAANSR